jgi:threonine/homoserine/homoserine lactone efflux protein
MQVKKQEGNDRKMYWDCWVNKCKCNLVNPKQWVNILSMVFSFSTKSNVIINNITMISVIHVTKAKQNLDATNETISM